VHLAKDFFRNGIELRQQMLLAFVVHRRRVAQGFGPDLVRPSPGSSRFRSVANFISSFIQ
jgi:hypothetical protein